MLNAIKYQELMPDPFDTGRLSDCILLSPGGLGCRISRIWRFQKLFRTYRRCARGFPGTVWPIDSQSPIWQRLGMKIAAFSLKLRANALEAWKATSYRLVHLFLNSGMGLVLSPLAVAAPGTTYDVSVAGKDVRVWLPTGSPVIRGLYIHGNGAGGDDRGITGRAHYQAFGAIHEFGIVGTKGYGNAMVSYDGPNFMEALRVVALASNRPELVHCPWVCGGMSNGGQMAYSFNAWKPERVIAFIVNKGCCYENRTPSAAALMTPGILIAGATDTATRRTSIQGLFNENRPRGALWCWVEEENTGHSTGDSDSLFLLFFSEAIKARYPSDQLPVGGPVQLRPVSEASGWLVDQSTWTSGITKVYPFASYPGISSSAGWLLNETVARYYQAFSSYNKLTSISAPANRAVNITAPTSVNFTAASTATPIQRIHFFERNTSLGSVAASSGTVPFSPSPMTAHGLTAVAELSDGSFRPSKLFSFFAEGTPAIGGNLTVEYSGVPISQGASVPTLTNGTDFGWGDSDGGPLATTFTIRNTGATTLNLPAGSAVNIFDRDSSQFVVDSQPPTSIAPGQTASFTVSYIGSAPGTHRVQVSVVTNATSPGPVFQFVITATRLTPRQAWRLANSGGLLWTSPQELVDAGLISPTVGITPLLNPAANEVTFLRRSDRSLNFAVQVSPDLNAWETIATGMSDQPMQGVGAWSESAVDGGSLVVIRDPSPSGSRFYRIQVGEANLARSSEPFATGSNGYTIGQLGGQNYRGTGYFSGGFYESSQGNVTATTLSYTKTRALQTSGGSLALSRDGLTFGILDTTASSLFGPTQPSDSLETGLIGRDGSAIYFSFLTKITTNGNVGFSLFRGFSELTFVGVSTNVQGSTYDVLVGGLALNGSSSAVSTGIQQDSGTRLIVGKIDFRASNADTITFWIDPVPGEPETSPGASAIIQTTAGSKNLAFDRWRFYSDTGGSSLDEVRFGTTFESVTPRASP